MTTEPRSTQDLGQDSPEIRTTPPPHLLLKHREAHAPTYNAIGVDSPLYDLAAVMLHHPERLPLDLRACLMYGLARAWPKAEGPHKGAKRYRAQWAHHGIEVANLDPALVGAQLGVTAEHAKRLAREYRREAERERQHAKSAGLDDYGIPYVEPVAPGRREDAPYSPLPAPGWFGQAMLSVDPEKYRRELLLPRSFAPASDSQPTEPPREVLGEDEEADVLRAGIKGRSRGLRRTPVRSQLHEPPEADGEP